jgi:hypothetical protein
MGLLRGRSRDCLACGHLIAQLRDPIRPDLRVGQPQALGRAGRIEQRESAPQHQTGVGDDYWLRHCRGFRVHSRRGRRGIVEDVLYGAEHDHPSALVVRGGLFGQRLELIPIETVDSVEPSRKLLTLDDSRRDH